MGIVYRRVLVINDNSFDYGLRETVTDTQNNSCEG